MPPRRKRNRMGATTSASLWAAPLAGASVSRCGFAGIEVRAVAASVLAHGGLTGQSQMEVHGGHGERVAEGASDRFDDASGHGIVLPWERKTAVPQRNATDPQR